MESVLQFPAGYTHRNLILSQFCMPTAKMRKRLFNTLPNCSYYVHDDSGYRISESLLPPPERSLTTSCSASAAAPAGFRGKAGWLARMMEAWEKTRGPGLYGSLSSKIKVRPHLNTTGFWCAPQMLRGYPSASACSHERTAPIRILKSRAQSGVLDPLLHNAGTKVMLVNGA